MVEVVAWGGGPDLGQWWPAVALFTVAHHGVFEGIGGEGVVGGASAHILLETI